jgi:hypothetical protein
LPASTAEHASSLERDEVESTQPEFLVFVGIQTSWLARPGSPQEVAFFTLAQRFMAENYEPAGMVDIFSSGTQYRWGMKPDYNVLVRRFLCRSSQEKAFFPLGSNLALFPLLRPTSRGQGLPQLLR